MASKRSQIMMTDDEVRAYLESERVLNVATIGPTGHPHLVAMWYRDGRRQACVLDVRKSQKILNLRRDPKMTGLVESGDTYDQLRGVELRGTGRDRRRLRPDPRDRQGGRSEVQRAVGLDDSALPFLEAQATKRLGVVFEIEHIASWDHTKLGGRD